MNKKSGHRLFSIVLAFLLISVLSSWSYGLEIHQKIQGPFSSSGDVTAACLQCHNQQAVEVLQSTHWTWVRQRAVNGKNTLFGKKDSLTGFAIDVSSNPLRCMGCHISNTRPDVNLDTTAPEMVDCLVCHDTTGTYLLTASGEPADHRPDLELIARNVSRPAAFNCMTCHFADCGLPGTDQSGITSFAIRTSLQDIHMNRTVASFTCQDCHLQTSGHSFTRKIGRMNDSSEEGCASCHTVTPHVMDQLNRHAITISCQTCHIPQYAQKNPAIISWNWIMSGKSNRVYQNRSSRRSLVQDENGFISSTKLEPVYLWDDGGDHVYSRGQRISPQELTYLQRPSERSPKSKITPFRVIYGTQLYDTKYRYLISPLMQPTGSTLFPGSDWEAVARQGMQAIVLPFSGQYGFAPTAALRRINHGVVSAAESLSCLDCHGQTSRMPWRELGFDQDPWSTHVRTTTENEEDVPEMNPEPPAQLNPVQETVVPPAPSN